MTLNAEKILLLIEFNRKFDEHKRQIYKNIVEYLSINDLDQVSICQSRLEFAIHMELAFIEKLSTMSDSAVIWYRKNDQFQLDAMFNIMVGLSDL